MIQKKLSKKKKFEVLKFFIGIVISCKVFYFFSNFSAKEKKKKGGIVTLYTLSLYYNTC